jgi:serine/threonine protein kinase
MSLRDGDPSRIGRYRLSARLGTGGMGVVYLGTAKDGTQVAVKVLRPELADDQEFRVRFRREVAALTRVQGLCTVRVIEAETESASPFLATEYADGPSLAEHVSQNGPLGPDMLYGLATGLAEALTAIHAAGVIHRDLKPGNVLLTQGGPKVIDFGIAQALDATAVTKTGMIVGSPGFMAPEQILGEAGQPADVFAWGLTVAYAASGQSPFGTGPTDAILYRIAHEAPDLSSVPEQLRSLVEATLAKDPAVRPTAPDLLRQLASAFGQPDDPADAPTQSVLARTWLPPEHGSPDVAVRGTARRYALILASAGVIAAIAGACVAVVISGSPRQSGTGVAGTHPPSAARTTKVANVAGSTVTPSPPVSSKRAATPPSSSSPSSALPIVNIGIFSGKEPSQIGFSGDSGDYVQKIAWTSWSATGATGEGVSYYDSCNPDCASGTMTSLPTEITLSDPLNGVFTMMTETRDGSTSTWVYPYNWPEDAS